MPPGPAQRDYPASTPTPERAAANALPSAAILAFVGGLLDAFLYLQHGRVFAGAMTGNAVLCGIALLSRNGLNALHHALPIVGFLCGVWLAEVLQGRVKHHSVTLALGAEGMGLLVASFLPRGFPDPAFVFLIAFLAAFQVASFRRADQFSYNSTFITGDMRTFVVGVYESLNPVKRRAGLRQARDLGVVIGAFLGGAIAGALLGPRVGNHTLWLPAAGLGVVFTLALRRSRTGQAVQAGGSPTE